MYDNRRKLRALPIHKQWHSDSSSRSHFVRRVRGTYNMIYRSTSKYSCTAHGSQHATTTSTTTRNVIIVRDISDIPQGGVCFSPFCRLRRLPFAQQLHSLVAAEFGVFSGQLLSQYLFRDRHALAVYCYTSCFVQQIDQKWRRNYLNRLLEFHYLRRPRVISVTRAV